MVALTIDFIIHMVTDQSTVSVCVSKFVSKLVRGVATTYFLTFPKLALRQNDQ